MTLWRSIRNNPLLRLELQRVHRRRWWPGRRFLMCYPAALGAALGCGVAFALGDLFRMRLAAIAFSVPAACLLSALASLLGFALPWIAPALTAPAIARERELGTFDLLRTTLLTEHAIVLGKLGGCAVWLWPGLLALAFLTPFRLVWTFGGVTGGLPGLALLDLLEVQAFERSLWVWLVLAGVTGLLKPWGDLVFQAAIGLFISVLTRSRKGALVITYGTILAVRVVLGLAMALLFSLWFVLGLRGMHIPDMLAVEGGVSLAMVVAEIAAGFLLTWAAIRWLKRV